MIVMHSKYDNMYKNGMIYALICINNHIITDINYMLLVTNIAFIEVSRYRHNFNGFCKKFT